MTSTITAGTLKVTIRENITLKGKDQGSITELSISDINEISSRIVTATTTEAGLMGFCLL